MAFWKGAMIGAMAGAAYGVWTAPRSGKATRARIEEAVEDSLFRLTGMEVWRPAPEQHLPPEWYATAANPADWAEGTSA
jgi:hypothetical protein